MVPTCGKCSGAHPTLECEASTLSCTLCGSADHQTNDLVCPERQKRESVILTKDPEILTPYYSTAERWTWGLLQQGNTTLEDPSVALREPQRDMHHPRPVGQAQHIPKRQGTLLGSGFQCLPTQTGANSTPIVNPRWRATPSGTPSGTPAFTTHSFTRPVNALPSSLALTRSSDPSPNRPSCSAVDAETPAQQETSRSVPNPSSHHFNL